LAKNKANYRELEYCKNTGFGKARCSCITMNKMLPVEFDRYRLGPRLISVVNVKTGILGVLSTANPLLLLVGNWHHILSVQDQLLKTLVTFMNKAFCSSVYHTLQ